MKRASLPPSLPLFRTWEAVAVGSAGAASDNLSANSDCRHKGKEGESSARDGFCDPVPEIETEGKYPIANTFHTDCNFHIIIVIQKQKNGGLKYTDFFTRNGTFSRN